MEEDLDRFWLDREKAVLVVVDVQEKLIPTMPQAVYRRTLESIDFLVRVAGELKVPVVATEQYPKGLGATVPELAGACRQKMIEKVAFGSCGEPAFLQYLERLGRSQVIVTGMEAHVCVLQTALGLLKAGYLVHLVRDAVISRDKVDYLNALEMAGRAGAAVTTAETAVFQMMRSSTIPEFRTVSALVKKRGEK